MPTKKPSEEPDVPQDTPQQAAATDIAQQDEETAPAQQEANPGEPVNVVDPPEATSDDTYDPERGAETGWVTISQQATVTLPSGASYALSPGETLQLQAEDAAFVVGEGYGTEADEPSGE